MVSRSIRNITKEAKGVEHIGKVKEGDRIGKEKEEEKSGGVSKIRYIRHKLDIYIFCVVLLVVSKFV